MSLTKKDAVRRIIEAFPRAAQDNRLLVLMCWSIIDGIDIPTETIEAILERGSSPESLTRLARFALTEDVQQEALVR